MRTSEQAKPTKLNMTAKDSKFETKLYIGLHYLFMHEISFKTDFNYTGMVFNYTKNDRKVTNFHG